MTFPTKDFDLINFKTDLSRKQFLIRKAICGTFISGHHNVGLCCFTLNPYGVYFISYDDDEVVPDILISHHVFSLKEENYE